VLPLSVRTTQYLYFNPFHEMRVCPSLQDRHLISKLVRPLLEQIRYPVSRCPPAGGSHGNPHRVARIHWQAGRFGCPRTSDLCPSTRRLREGSRLTLRTSHNTINGGRVGRRSFIPRYEVRRRPYRPRCRPPDTREGQGWTFGFGVPADPWPSLVESRCAMAATRRVLRCGATTAR